MVKNKILKRIVAGLSCIALSTTMLTSLPAFADDYVDELSNDHQRKKELN